MIVNGAPMSTIEIKLPDDLRAAVDEQVAKGRYASQSDYLRSLIEGDQRRLKLEAMLAGRMAETDEVVMDSADVKAMRDEFLRGRA